MRLRKGMMMGLKHGVPMPTTSTPRLWLSPSFGITLDGSGNVESWTDKITGTLAATQSNAAKRPALTGGKVVFGGGQSLSITSLNLSNSQDAKVISVSKLTAMNGTTFATLYAYGNNVDTGSSDWAASYLFNGGAVDKFQGAMRGNAGFSIWNGQYVDIVTNPNHTIYTTEFCRSRGSGSETRVRRNGALSGAVLLSSDNTNTPTANPFHIGGKAGASNYFIGELKDILVFDSDLADSEIVKWENYIAYINTINI